MPAAGHIGELKAPWGSHHILTFDPTLDSDLALYLAQLSKDMIVVKDDFYGTLSTLLWNENHVTTALAAADHAASTPNSQFNGGVITASGIGTMAGSGSYISGKFGLFMGLNNPGIEARIRVPSAACQIEMGFLDVVPSSGSGVAAVSAVSVPATATGVVNAALLECYAGDPYPSWTIVSQGANDAQVASASLPSGLTPMAGIATRVRLQLISLPAGQVTQSGSGLTQTITITNVAQVGGWRIGYLGQYTSAFVYDNQTAASIQTAVRLLPGLGSVTVTGSTGGPYTVTMTSAPVLTPLQVVSADTAALIATIDDSLDPIAMNQIITFPGAPTGGTFTIGYLGAYTAAITYSSSLSAATVQTAVQLVTALASATVTGPNGGPYNVTMTGVATPIQLLTTTDSTTGGTAPNIAVALASGHRFAQVLPAAMLDNGTPLLPWIGFSYVATAIAYPTIDQCLMWGNRLQ